MTLAHLEGIPIHSNLILRLYLIGITDSGRVLHSCAHIYVDTLEQVILATGVREMKYLQKLRLMFKPKIMTS